MNLLETIEVFIRINGGRLRLAEIIENEQVKTPYHIRPKRERNELQEFENTNYKWYKQSEIDYLINNYGTKQGILAKKLGRSVAAIENKLLELRKKGLIPSKYGKVNNRKQEQNT